MDPLITPDALPEDLMADFLSWQSQNQDASAAPFSAPEPQHDSSYSPQGLKVRLNLNSGAQRGDNERQQRLDALYA